MAKKIVNKQTKQAKNEKAKNKIKQYSYAFVSVIVIAMAIVGIVLLTKNKGENGEVKRFEEITHITLKQFNALTGNSESDDDYGDLDLDYLAQIDLFVFVYNPDFDNEELEDLINRYANNYKHNILVMNYQENQGISELFSKLRLPEVPGLIHIHLDEATNDSVYLNMKQIQTALAYLD